MNWLVIMVSIVAISGSTPLACESRKDIQVIVVHYLPFDHDTFTPVTVESIEEQAHCRFEILPSSREAKLLEQLVLDMEVGAFDPEVVRLKVVGLFEDTLYLDQDGGILVSPRQAEGRSDPEGFEELQGLLRERARDSGCGG